VRDPERVLAQFDELDQPAVGELPNTPGATASSRDRYLFVELEPVAVALVTPSVP